MIRATFRGAPGIGPSRERELWARGMTDWDDLPTVGPILAPKLDVGLRSTVARWSALLAEGRLRELGAQIPATEHHRLWPTLERDVVCLDIETDGMQGQVTAVGTWSEQDGPRSFVRGLNLEATQEALEGKLLLVTFNGASFDVPILRRELPGLRFPPMHVDLCQLWRRLGEGGGLKALERRLGLARPGSVEGVGGLEAVALWHHWRLNRDATALRRLVEYNLYDAIMLRPLLDLAWNRTVERAGLPLPARHVWDRAEALYDVSRILDALPR